MPAIELSRNTDLPATLLAQEILFMLTAIERGERSLSIAADIHDLHLPDAGRVAVPLVVKLGRTYGRPPQRVDLSFEGQPHGLPFPKFNGSVRFDAFDTSRCTVVLIGSYSPPMGWAGKALDATMMRGVATKTLHSLLEDIVSQASTAIQKRETDAARTRRLNQ